MDNIAGMDIHMQRRQPQRLRLARFTQPLEMRQPHGVRLPAGLLPVFKQRYSVIRQPRRGCWCR
jgi:hypothetical protein